MKFDCTFVALSYRGFWKSAGRASQSGIEKDAATALRHIQKLRDADGRPAKVVFWGQSIGAGVAAFAASVATKMPGMIVDGLILETPFLSIKEMLITLYPQNWLPYRYLWPLLWNHWDSVLALKAVAQHRSTPKVLILAAEKDEVVPPDHAARLTQLCNSEGLFVSHTLIYGALHTEVTVRQQGRAAISAFLRVSFHENDNATRDELFLAEKRTPRLT